MSTKLKLNVKNVILGCHNFGEILARHDSSMKSGFSRLVKPCPYFKQDHVRTYTRNHAEAVRPRSLDNESLKPITNSQMPLISNRFDEVRSIDRISIAAYGLPWESPIRFYYDRDPLKCPPPSKEVKDCVVPPVPPCPPVTKTPKCPTKPTCYPCKKPNRCAKMTPCTLKTFPLNNCRFFSGSPCQPILPSSRSKSKFKPRREIRKPTPKCRSPVYTGATICNATAARDPCKPKFGAGGGGGGAGAGAGGGGGGACAGAKEAPKECYKKCTPGNIPGSGASKKGGPVCPPK